MIRILSRVIPAAMSMCRFKPGLNVIRLAWGTWRLLGSAARHVHPESSSRSPGIMSPPLGPRVSPKVLVSTRTRTWSPSLDGWMSAKRLPLGRGGVNRLLRDVGVCRLVPLRSSSPSQHLWLIGCATMVSGAISRAVLALRQSNCFSRHCSLCLATDNTVRWGYRQNRGRVGHSGAAQMSRKTGWGSGAVSGPCAVQRP